MAKEFEIRREIELPATPEQVWEAVATVDGLYRFFDRSVWGWPIRLGHHLFADNTDQEKVEHAWQEWLDGVFA